MANEILLFVPNNSKATTQVKSSSLRMVQMSQTLNKTNYQAAVSRLTGVEIQMLKFGGQIDEHFNSRRMKKNIYQYN